MVAWPCLLWGAGTAIGEIPPYAVSRAARLAGEANEELDEWIENESASSVVNAMRDWMFVSLEKYGFWAILAFAAWPNMAFDLCGLACGHFLIPFWVFFGATFIGKALIKVNGQALFFITIFRKEYLDVLVRFVERFTPEAWNIDEKVNEAFLKQRARFMPGADGAATATASSPTAPPAPLLARLWSVVMIAFIGWFALSVVHSFAQQRAASDIRREAAEAKESARIYYATQSS
ncbi:transmembrane protein 49, partial [Thecamonas trahens ATCC 50062]